MPKINQLDMEAKVLELKTERKAIISEQRNKLTAEEAEL